MVRDLLSNLLFLGLEESFVTLLFLHKIGKFRKFSFIEYLGYSIYLSFMRFVPPLFRQVLLIAMTSFWLTIRDKENLKLKKLLNIQYYYIYLQ